MLPVVNVDSWKIQRMGIYSTFDLQFISEPSIYVGICHFLNLSAFRFYKKNIYIKREKEEVPWMSVSKEFQRDAFIYLQVLK